MQCPETGRHPGSLRVRVQGRAQSLVSAEQERGVRGWERPLGSRAQMVSFCFLNILPRTCETLYLGTWRFCLYLEKRSQFHGSHKRDQDEGVSLPGADSPSDRRGLNQHWGRHSQGQGSDGSDTGVQGKLSSHIPITREFLWLWLVMSCVTLMTSLCIRMGGAQVIQEGVWSNQLQENRAEPLTPPDLCSRSQRQAFAWNPLSSLPGGPRVLAAPSAGDGAPGFGLIRGITGAGTWTQLGEPLLLTGHRPHQP